MKNLPKKLEKLIASVIRLTGKSKQLATIVVLEPDEENTGVYSYIYCSKCDDEVKLINLVGHMLSEKAKEIQESKQVSEGG